MMRKIICIITACVMIITMFSGCALLQKLGLQKNNNDELHPVSSIVMNEDEAKKLNDKIPVHLYFANEDNTKLKLDIKYITVSEAKKSTTALATFIVNELIKGPADKIALKPTIPTGTKLRSVTIKGSVATVDFSKEFVDNHPGGKTAEQLTLYSVVNSLTELKEIEKVKFTVNGQLRKEFKGSFQLDAPFPRMVALISKPTSIGAAAATKDTSKKDTDTTKKDSTKNNTKTDDKKSGDTKKSGDSKSTGDTKSIQGSVDTGEDAEAAYSDNLE